MENKTKGWRVGQAIDNLTWAGKEPSWRTVRARFWKNEAFYRADFYSKEALDRMRRGRAPMHPKFNVPMEIHHIGGRDIPNPHRADNLEALWPWEHAAVDKFRHYTGPKPNGY